MALSRFLRDAGERIIDALPRVGRDVNTGAALGGYLGRPAVAAVEAAENITPQLTVAGLRRAGARIASAGATAMRAGAAGADMVASGIGVAYRALGTKAGRTITAGAGLYFGGEAIKSFSQEYQKTPGFNDMSAAGQTAFKSTAFMLGSAMQMKGAFGSAGKLATMAGYGKTGAVLGHIGNLGLSSPTARQAASSAGSFMGSVVKGAAKIPGKAIYGGAEVGGSLLKSAVKGVAYGPKAGLTELGTAGLTMKHPFFGAAAVGGVVGATRAVNIPNRQAQLTPRTQGSATAMNRGNYQRVSQRSRRRGV